MINRRDALAWAASLCAPFAGRPAMAQAAEPLPDWFFGS